MLARAVGQVCFDFANHIMHFCAHSACWCHAKYFCMYILWMLLFPLYCCCLFLLWNSKISGACFCLFHFCTLHSVLVCVVRNYLFVFSHCFLHVDFVCVIDCLSYFLQWFCALFYSLLLPNCSLLHFCFCRFFSVPLPRFYCLSGCAICFFLCCRVCLLAMLCYDVLFELFHFCCWYFCSFRAVVFCLFCLVWINLNLLVLVVFALLHIFFLLIFCYRHIKLSRAPFFCRHSPHMILSDHLNHPCQLPAFFSPGHESQNKHDTTTFASFSVVFRSIHAYACNRTHWNPSFIHLHVFMHLYVWSQKHDVRGNFPGHRGRKHALIDDFCLCLPCFCVVPGLWTPSHPSKPIHTHLHPYVSVPTINSTVYMYYLC